MRRTAPRRLVAWWLPLILLVAAACASLEDAPDRLALGAADFDDLAGWQEDSHGAALIAFLRSCHSILRRADARAMGGVIPGRVADWRPVCEAATAADPGDDAAAREFFEDWFVPYEARNNADTEGFITGYYEPELRGALYRSARYSVPLFARPPDLVMVNLGRFRDSLRGERIAGRVEDGALEPYPTRAEIDDGVLDGKGYELVWLDQAVDAFFLHIQGSGRVTFEDGTVRRIGYAATNGQVYFPIGRRLVERGALSREDASMQTIRAWLEANPTQAQALMQENRSYVFFRWLDESEAALGPIGAQGVPLLAGRSLAVDRRFLPLGVPLWLVGAAPETDPTLPDRALRRLLIAQDTGGAIRGPLRADLFWGTGPEAGEIAGRMKHAAQIWLLLPRGLDVGDLVN